MLKDGGEQNGKEWQQTTLTTSTTGYFTNQFNYMWRHSYKRQCQRGGNATIAGDMQLRHHHEQPTALTDLASGNTGQSMQDSAAVGTVHKLLGARGSVKVGGLSFLFLLKEKYLIIFK